MNNRKSLFFVLLLCLLVVAGVGCSPAPKDGVPTTITPNVIRVRTNSVATIEVFLSKPREVAGTMTFRIENTDIASPGVKVSDVTVPIGEESVFFTIQGIAVGETRIFASIDGFQVSAPISVSSQ